MSNERHCRRDTLVYESIVLHRLLSLLPILPVLPNRLVHRRPILAPPLPAHTFSREVPLQSIRWLKRRVRIAQRKLPKNVQTALDVRALPSWRQRLPVPLQRRDDDAEAVQLVRERGVEEAVRGAETDVGVAVRARGRPFE